MGRVETRLNEVLALGLGDERLELGGGEGVHETGLGHDEQEHLRACECRELVRLFDRAMQCWRVSRNDACPMDDRRETRMQSGKRTYTMNTLYACGHE